MCCFVPPLLAAVTKTTLSTGSSSQALPDHTPACLFLQLNLEDAAVHTCTWKKYSTNPPRPCVDPHPPSPCPSSSTPSLSLHSSQVGFSTFSFCSLRQIWTKGEQRRAGSQGATVQKVGPYTWWGAHSPRGSISLSHCRSTKTLLEWGYIPGSFLSPTWQQCRWQRLRLVQLHPSRTSWDEPSFLL